MQEEEQGCDDPVGRDGIQDGTGRVFSKIPLESLLSRGTGRDGRVFFKGPRDCSNPEEEPCTSGTPGQWPAVAEVMTNINLHTIFHGQEQSRAWQGQGTTTGRAIAEQE